METDKKQTFKNFTQGYFTRGYTFKILMLVLLVLLLLIPLAMIRGMINERNRTANEAESDIMEAWGKQLIAAGPIIAISGIKTEEARTRSEREGEKVEIVKKPFTLVVTPRKLDITANFKTEVRRRGIFSVPLFSGELALSGAFNPEAALLSLKPGEEIALNQAELIIALSSQKGIRKINLAQWNGRELFFQPGNRGQNIAAYNNYDRQEGGVQGSGIYAALPEFSAGEAVFKVNIAIQGGQSVRFLPVGQDTHAAVSADWASPSFQGSFLPGESAVTEQGFDAQWDISYLSRDIPLFWKNSDGEGGSSGAYADSLFGVNFFRSINTYSLNTRAVKYAILFLIVPFLTLFLLEVFTRRRIHPVPYLLSGIANIIFYLLLLSLSEQMRFYFAYLCAAAAVTVMLTLYSRALLPSWSKSWYMGLSALLSYVLLYAVLNAESYALLIGSIGAFALVGCVMFLTRKLDWYGQDADKV